MFASGGGNWEGGGEEGERERERERKRHEIERCSKVEKEKEKENRGGREQILIVDVPAAIAGTLKMRKGACECVFA